MAGTDRTSAHAAVDPTMLSERLAQESPHYWLHLEAASRLEKYPAKQHARRMQEKLGVRKGLVYLAGQPTRNNDDSDMPAPWRQRRYFYYLSGVDEPNCHVTYDIQNDVLTLFLPRVDPKRVIWNGRGSTPAEALDKYDLDQVFYVDELEDYVYDWMKFNRGDLYLLHPAQSPQYNGLYGNIDSDSLQPAMNRARIIKDDYEVQMIRKANDLSSTAHKQVLANILRFKNEAQVEGLFLNACISRQAKQQAYDPIAASGVNAGTLHYDANNEDFEDRQLMCLDAGCEWKLYASDITRTFPLSGSWPSAEAKNTYLLVQKMQDTCISRLGPGVRYLDLHILAHQIAIDGLLKLGILHNGTKEEIFKAGTSRAFFPHGLGHHLGLEVHDVGQGELMSAEKGYSRYENVPSLYPENFHQPVYDSDSCMAPTDPRSPHLEDGMVVTVEPGIYFSVYALNMFYLPSPIHSKYINLEVVKKYLPVGGVRIEDDILITSKGYENLTTAPKGEDMLEIIRSQNVLPIRLPRTSSVQISKAEKEEVPQRAPGISKDTPEPILKPISRAATLPVDRKDRKSVDFEPFEGPSSYSGFKRASTIDIPTASRPPGVPTFLQNAAKPLCGKLTQGFRHTYLKVGEESTRVIPPVWPYDRDQPTTPCPRCSILTQTLDRLSERLGGPDVPAKLEVRSTRDLRDKVDPAPWSKQCQAFDKEPTTRPTYQGRLDCDSGPDTREADILIQKAIAREKQREEQEKLKKLQKKLKLTRAQCDAGERHAWLEKERSSYHEKLAEGTGVSRDQEEAARKALPTLVPLPMKNDSGSLKADNTKLQDQPRPALSLDNLALASHNADARKAYVKLKDAIETVQKSLNASRQDTDIALTRTAPSPGIATNGSAPFTVRTDLAPEDWRNMFYDPVIDSERFSQARRRSFKDSDPPVSKNSKTHSSAGRTPLPEKQQSRGSQVNMPFRPAPTVSTVGNRPWSLDTTSSNAAFYPATLPQNWQHPIGNVTISSTGAAQLSKEYGPVGVMRRPSSVDQKKAQGFDGLGRVVHVIPRGTTTDRTAELERRQRRPLQDPHIG